MIISIPVVGLTSHGGVRILVQLANIATEAGHQVIFYCPRGTNRHVFHLDERVEVVELGLATRNKYISWVLFSLIFPFVNKGELIVANHFFTYYPSVLARKKRKVAYPVQDVEFRFYPGLLSLLAYLICKGTYRSKNLYAANRYLYEELKRYTNPRGYMNLGIDPVFATHPFPDAAQGKAFDVLYFLRGEHHKRLDRFEHILPHLLENGRKVLCVSQDDELLESFSRRGVTVRKPRNDAELVECMDSARVMVLTSDQEGFALPPLECMARGLPAVLYDCGGPRDYAVNGENALVLENADSAPLLDSIEKLLDDPALYARLSANARHTALRYDVKTELTRFLQEITEDM